MKIPSYLESGNVARLFPVISETRKEERASSILLSVISAVPQLADAIFSQIGQRVGARASVDTYTEVVFKNENGVVIKDRPDGLVVVSVGKRTWRVLIETKIGKNILETEQVEKYLRLARNNSVDAVITISNQFVVSPTHSPLKIQKNLLRRVSLFHFSWSSILTAAVLMHERSELNDPEQAFLLREFVRFFSHDSAGIVGYSSMPSEWTQAIEQIQHGGGIAKGSFAQAIIKGWSEEIRDLSLVLSNIIGCHVSAKISRAHKGDAELYLKDKTEELCKTQILNAEMMIPDAAAELEIVADLKGRTIRVYMTLNAPKDKKKSSARVNWLLRQLKDIENEHVSVGVVWASRAQTSVFSLSDLRENPSMAGVVTNSSEIRAFEISLSTSGTQKFTGRRKFIEELEKLAPTFYELVGQRLHAWKASPPKPVHSVALKVAKEVKKEHSDVAFSGNSHSSLMEIPSFLKRFTA